ncbi:MAG TPA: histidine phosphatase family protein [Acidimicrobiia bacterium]
MRQLLLMRHAKSDWSADYSTDHDRPLNDRGVRSARAMGRVLRDNDQVPDLVVTSSATRAKTTAQLAADAGAWESEIVVDSRLYGAGADSVVEMATEFGETKRLMLVGHQPTWSIVVSLLTGESVEMKTATVAVLRFDLSAWSELPGATGEVEKVFQPRDYID